MLFGNLQNYQFIWQLFSEEFEHEKIYILKHGILNISNEIIKLWDKIKYERKQWKEKVVEIIDSVFTALHHFITFFIIYCRIKFNIIKTIYTIF